MRVSKTVNQKHNFVVSNRNIFDITKQRITSGHNGATVFIPHVCNNADMYGAGFALDIANKFPSAKTDYHLLGKKFLQTNLGYSQIIKVAEDPKYKHKLYVVNMIAQNGIKSPNNPRPLNYFALGQCMYRLSQFIHNNTDYTNNNEKIEIHCPKFGSGLAGGNWNFIGDLIDDVWGRFFVTVYNFNPK